MTLPNQSVQGTNKGRQSPGSHNYKEKLLGDVAAGDGAGYSGNKTRDLKNLRETSNAKSRITTLDFRRAGLQSSGTCLEKSSEMMQ